MSARLSRVALLSLFALLLAWWFFSGRAERSAKARPGSSSAPTASPARAPSAAPTSTDAGLARLVRVRAKNALGAPLHATPETSSVSGRVPDGSSARILSASADGRWFEIEAAGLRGFVTRRYLDLPPLGPTAALEPDSPWSSREACFEALRQPSPPRNPKLARVGSWNLRWFPDGRPGNSPADGGTDLEWLACAITLSRFDALAVQEIKHGARVEAALAKLTTRLGELGGGAYRALIDDCPAGASQHVGFIYDERRVRLKQHTTLAELNPHGAPCKDQLRPGLAGYFSFPGGLDLTLVAVHLKSGASARDLALRELSFRALAKAADRVRQLTSDSDILVLGDMNTMGCESCSPRVSAEDELVASTSRIGSAAFRRIPSDLGCSHFYSGRTTLLDWAAAASLAELPAARAATISGFCGELGCSSAKRELDAQRRLSDHCPFVIELDDRDSDERP
jgi:endonuclease/exonuclease/phosphatase family metal-dependent hydrolase